VKHVIARVVFEEDTVWCDCGITTSVDGFPAHRKAVGAKNNGGYPVRTDEKHDHLDFNGPLTWKSTKAQKEAATA
jgi:hypothetical protein